jgi:hypothetical protein
MGTLRGALDEIAADLRDLAGIKYAPNDPPTGMQDYPFAVTRVSRGAYRQTHAAGGNSQGLHTVEIEIHIGAYDQIPAYRKIVELLDEIPKKLVNQRNTRAGGGHGVTWFDVEGGGIAYQVPPQGMSYQGVITYGIIYTIPELKVEVSLA